MKFTHRCVEFDGIDQPGAHNAWKERLDGKFVKREDAMVYLDNQPALSSKNARSSVPDGSWQLAGIDSCRWKEDPGVPCIMYMPPLVDQNE